jgi:hypothetical protein
MFSSNALVGSSLLLEFTNPVVAIEEHPVNKSPVSPWALLLHISNIPQEQRKGKAVKPKETLGIYSSKPSAMW